MINCFLKFKYIELNVICRLIKIYVDKCEAYFHTSVGNLHKVFLHNIHDKVVPYPTRK